MKSKSLSSIRALPKISSLKQQSFTKYLETSLQNHKLPVSDFVQFFIAFAKVLVLERRLGTRLYLNSFWDFLEISSSSMILSPQPFGNSWGKLYIQFLHLHSILRLSWNFLNPTILNHPATHVEQLVHSVSGDNNLALTCCEEKLDFNVKKSQKVFLTACSIIISAAFTLTEILNGSF